MTKSTRLMLAMSAAVVAFFVGTMFSQYARQPLVYGGADGFGHWNHSGSDLFTEPAITRVGIGTQSPQANLEVEIPGNAYMRIGGPNGLLDISTSDVGFPLYIAGSSTSDVARFRGRGGIEVLYLTGDGKVGVGTPWPSERLQVEGNIFLNGSGTQKITSDGEICIGSGC